MKRLDEEISEDQVNEIAKEIFFVCFGCYPQKWAKWDQRKMIDIIFMVKKLFHVKKQPRKGHAKEDGGKK